MKLYDLDLSGNCYKVRLFAALSGMPLELVNVDVMGGEHKRGPFLELNPFGQIPVLDDGGHVVRDSQAILVYLANRHGDEQWWPADAAGQAEIVGWLAVAAHEVRVGPADARMVDKFGMDLDKPTTEAASAALLPLLDAHFSKHDWAALDRPTIADCALFPYLALAHEGGIDVTPHGALCRWMARVQALPGYVGMPGIR
ncbi:MAG: glutathione S-transferase family protein [Rhodocyclaceae bacterium]|nr:glutathione S-transferase family protein [Rhodocyclaceae bacterium]